MNIIKLVLPVLIILMLIMTGCAASGLTGSAGSAKAAVSTVEVRNVMGNPGRVEHQDNYLKWYYKSEEGLTIYFFKDKKLTIVYNREY